jgi:citrate lyase gamma subunit
MQKGTAKVAEAAACPPDRLPTLTEVVDWAARPVASAPRALATAEPLPAAAPDLSADVLFELESRIQAQFESRLREALAPALARVADGLIREARGELSAALRDLVEDAVNRAIERRTRG